MRFYIADCHFGHDKVRLLDGRPFASVEEMDEAMDRSVERACPEEER